MGCLWVERFHKVVGKQISGVIISKHDDSPRDQVFLVFNDGTYYELYGSDIGGCNDIDKGTFDDLSEFVRSRRGTNVLLEYKEKI